MTALENTLKEKFSPCDGPFFQCLDKSSKQLNVKCQAFHGATFVGNHVHKLLQVCTKTLCMHQARVGLNNQIPYSP